MEKEIKLEFEHVTKCYGEKKALNDFTTVLTPGIYGLLGPNGAGKSTLMNLLTDNIRRTSGEILYNGEEILKSGAKFRSKIGYMPQQQGMYEQFSGERFLYYIAALKGMKKRDAAQQIEKYLELVGLKKDSKRRVGGYSGGMRQRLMFVAALLGDPEILILDEPTAGLDPNERIAMRNLIAKEALDRIVILATHIISDVECVADEIVLMKKGQLVGCKTPEVWLDDVKPYVREFVCKPGEIEKIQEDYVVSNMRQCQEGISIRVIGEKFDGNIFKLAETLPTLDDVYLYFASV